MKSIKICYYPSTPFGRFVFRKLETELSQYHWQLADSGSKQSFCDLALVDSNALQLVDEVKENKVLLINAVIKPESVQKKPIHFHLPFMKQAFLKRSRRYQLEPLLQSYAYPSTWSKELYQQYKSKLEEKWEDLNSLIYKNKDQSSLLQDKTCVHIESTEDLLRSKDLFHDCESLKVNSLPHSLLAFTQEHWDLVKIKIQDLCR